MKQFFYLFAFATCTIFSSCTKPEDNPEPTTGYDIYIAGYQVNGVGQSVATYWKNGVRVELTDGSRDAWATDIFVSENNDVYVLGEETDVDATGQPTNNIVYWENGQRTIVATDATDAFSIFVKNSDVYVLGRLGGPGFSQGDAKYWKNGVASSFTNGGTRPVGYQITVSGNDIYVCGREDVPRTGGSQATYWKNGAAVTLGLNDSSYCYANSIAVSGNDVHAMGYEDYQTPYGWLNRVKYWKNGVEHLLTDKGYSECYGRMAVEGNDVYISGVIDTGNETTRAVYWKNGRQVSLENGNSNNDAYGIAVKKGDVIVCGRTYPSDSDDNAIATYWKNGSVTYLGDGITRSNAEAVFLK